MQRSPALCLAVLAVALAALTPDAAAGVMPPDDAAEISDLYAFVSPDSPLTVTVIATYQHSGEPAGGPLFSGFDDAVLYAFHVDNDDDCIADVTYEFRFTTVTHYPFSPFYSVGVISTLGNFALNLDQTYSVTRVDGGGSTVLGNDLLIPPAHVGPATTPNYDALAADAITALGGGRVFCGPRDDPFFMDGALHDLFTLRPGVPGTMGGGVDARGGTNVLAICLQIPIADLTLGGTVPAGPGDPDAVLGIWATSSRAESTDIAAPTPVHSGPSIQVRRRGMPMVDGLWMGLGQLAAYHAAPPDSDFQYVARFENPEPALWITSRLSVATPPTPRSDLVEAFLEGIAGVNQSGPQCDVLRLNVGIAPAVSEGRLGVLGGDNAGFPNGRRLADDVLDITLRLAAGARVSGFETSSKLGDGVDTNDLPFLGGFPYLASPHSAISHSHHPEYPITVSVVRDGPPPIPGSRLAALMQNVPNPFTPQTRIRFELQRASEVTLSFYDVHGRRVDRVEWPVLPAGSHDFVPRTERWAAGTYFYVLSAGGQYVSRRMTLIR